MTILDKAWKVDRDGERLYVYAPGEVCIDIVSGAPEDRRRVLALLAQVQHLAAVAKDAASEWCTRYRAPTECGACLACRARAVLRDAGVSDGHGRGGG